MKALAALLYSWGFFLTQASYALPPHETFFYDQVPSESQIQQWSLLPGTRSYTFQIANPYSVDLEVISRLRGADRIRIEVSGFPGEDSWQSWRKLAGQGVELVAFHAGFPTPDETERLGRIGFSRYTFVLPDYPGEGEAGRLSQLAAPVSVTFTQKAYPRYHEIPGLKALDASFPLQFTTDFWPWYAQMDVLRMLPHPKTLRIHDIYPTDQHFEYLHHISGLTEVIVDSDFEPYPNGEVWTKFKEIPVTWLSQDRVPNAEALREFAAWRGSKRVIIDQDFPLTTEELERLSALRVPVEWIHSPPFAK